MACCLLRAPRSRSLRPISVLKLSVGNFHVHNIGNFPEIVSQQSLAGTILVGRLGVHLLSWRVNSLRPDPPGGLAQGDARAWSTFGRRLRWPGLFLQNYRGWEGWVMFVLWVSCLLFNTIYHYFTGSSTEFTRISPECCQNTELEHLKTGDNHNSAFPPGLHLGSKASLQKGVLAGGPRTAHRFGRGSSGLPRRSTPSARCAAYPFRGHWHIVCARGRARTKSLRNAP